MQASVHDSAVSGRCKRAVLCLFLTLLHAGSAEEDAAGAAETSVDMCLGLERKALLWTDVVPRFEQAKALGALLDCLLPRILAGQLQSLAPEVMQVWCICRFKITRPASHQPGSRAGVHVSN